MNIITRNAQLAPFNEFLREMLTRQGWEGGAGPDAPEIRMDVREDEDGFTVHAEMAGVKKEDIHVTVDGQDVTISAERKAERETGDGSRVLRSERSFGMSTRSFRLGQQLDEGRTEAKFVDGVLEMRIPKKKPESVKRVAIS